MECTVEDALRICNELRALGAIRIEIPGQLCADFLHTPPDAPIRERSLSDDEAYIANALKGSV